MLRWKESGETFDGVEAWPWEDLIDLPVEQTSLDRYGEWACAAEILWKVTICGYSESRVNEMESVLARLFEELAEELVSSDPDDESEYEVNPLDVKATLDWFANAPDCVKRLVRNRISSDVIDEDDKRLALAKTLEKFKEIVGYEEPKTDDITRLLSMARELDDEQLALAKTLEKLKEIVGCNELKTDDITRLLLRMTRELDNDDELLLLRALDGDLGNSGEHENQTPI
jgi:hypothetical protein